MFIGERLYNKSKYEFMCVEELTNHHNCTTDYDTAEK